MKIQKIIAIICIVSVAFTAIMTRAFADDTQGVCVEAENVSVEKGTTDVSVKVNITNNVGIATIGFDIGYDANVMTLRSVECGNIFTESEMTPGDITSNPYVISMLRASGNTTDNGVVAILNFELAADCEDGVYPITVGDGGVFGGCFNINEEAVAINLISGSITVEKGQTETDESTTDSLSTESTTETTTESSTESTTVTTTESTTERVTETTTAIITENTTQATTESQTETTTERITQTTTEADTEATTDNVTQVTTENGTEITTERVTQTVTEGDTETTTRRHTSGGGGGGAGASSITVNGYKATTTTETTTNVDFEVTTEATTEEVTETISNDVRVTIGSKAVVIGDESYEMDVAPYIQAESNSTLVPLRFVALAIAGGDVENADSSENIVWDTVTKTAKITFDGRTIEFTAGSNVMVIDGRSQIMDNGVKAEITDGRMYIPFRALGEALGVDVEWDADTRTAIYSMNN